MLNSQGPHHAKVKIPTLAPDLMAWCQACYLCSSQSQNAVSYVLVLSDKAQHINLIGL